MESGGCRDKGEVRRRLLRLLANVSSLGTFDAHAPHHAAKRIRRLGWSLRRACGGVCKNADGDGLLGRYETLYKENKAKYDEEMKTYKNSDSYKEFAAKPKESTGDRAPSFPTSAFPQPGLPDSPASTLWLPWATHADSPRWAARVIVCGTTFPAAGRKAHSRIGSIGALLDAHKRQRQGEGKGRKRSQRAEKTAHDIHGLQRRFPREGTDVVRRCSHRLSVQFASAHFSGFSFRIRLWSELCFIQVKTENPTLKMLEIGQQLAKLWKEADEETKVHLGCSGVLNVLKRYSAFPYTYRWV